MNAVAEIKNVYLGLLDAYNTGNAQFMSDFTASEDMLVIGTDPDEWWENHESLLDALRVSLKQFRDAGVRVEPGNPQAFVEGTVGWIADRPIFYLPDGSQMESRVTAVMRYQDGVWKIAQQHFSYAIRNEELVDVNEQEISREVGA